MLAIFTRFKSDLLKPMDLPTILPVPQPDLELQVSRGYTVARKSFGKRMRCELTDDDDGRQEVSRLQKRKHEFAMASPLSPINLKVSKSDYQLKSSREVVEKPFDFTPGKLSTSVSHPCFPLSHPHNLLEPQKVGSPEGGGKHAERDPPTLRFAFTFSNPRPVSAKQKAATNIIGTSECKTPATSSTECLKAFQSARKDSESNEANLLEEERRNSLMMDSFDPTPQRCRTIHSSPRLDDAFLVTPFPIIGQSPNLLEKIKTEIAERHQFSPCTPHPLVEASVQVNDSYKEAVLGENYPFPLPEPLSLRFDTSDISTRVEDIGDMREGGEGTGKSGVSIGDMAVTGGDSAGTGKSGVSIGDTGGKVDCIRRQEGDGWSDKVQVIFVLSADNASSTNDGTSQQVAEKAPDQGLSSRPLVDAARVQSQTSNLPPPPLSSSITVQKPRLRAVKHRQKSEKHAGHKFQTPSASPRLFAFGRSSPWFRSHRHTELKFNK